MDRYEQLIVAIIIIAVLPSSIYFIAIIIGIINIDFRFFIFIPSWAVIYIPIIVQKKLEEKMRQN